MILIKKNFSWYAPSGVNIEKRHEETELDAKDRFASTTADDLRQLPARVKLLAKNEIRNTLFRYQMEMFNQHDQVGNVSLNNVGQWSGYTELLRSISPAMTYINQHETAGERNYQSL